MLPVRWMAPESLCSGVFTHKSDIWSYGVVLYEILTFSNIPYQGFSNKQVVEYIKAGSIIQLPKKHSEFLWVYILLVSFKICIMNFTYLAAFQCTQIYSEYEFTYNPHKSHISESITWAPVLLSSS